MANSLEVDADGLRVAAASSDAMSSTLTRPASSGTADTRPSSAGIAAVDSANASVRGRQSSRISSQVGVLSTGADRYDDTDGSSSDNLKVTV
jgi:hypothetical protein